MKDIKDIIGNNNVIGYIHIVSDKVGFQNVIDTIYFEIYKVIKEDNKIVELGPLTIIESALKVNDSFIKIDNSHRKDIQEVIKLLTISHIENDCKLYLIDKNDLQLRELLHSNNMCEIVYGSKLKIEDRLELAKLDNCVVDIRFTENYKEKYKDDIDKCSHEKVIDCMKNITIHEYNEE